LIPSLLVTKAYLINNEERRNNMTSFRMRIVMFAREIYLLPFVVGVMLLAACSMGDDDRSKVLATVDGEPVTMVDLDTLVGDRLALMDYEYQQERYGLVELALQRSIRNRLLEQAASARGVTMEQYVEQLTASVEVTEEEVVSLYDRNAAALAGRTLDELYEQIEDYIRNMKRQQTLDQVSEELAELHMVEILLEPVRVELDNEGSPSFGPSNAPITLTEFSDFECPYCGRFFATVNQLKQAYAGQLEIVYRQYPLDIHENAFKAAEASLCADDQGKFWEMHDLLFMEQESLGVEALKEKASRLGLDSAQFDTCLASGQYVEQIEGDMREGSRLGLEGTPYVFINGVKVPGGAAPYDVMARMIDQELERRR
jgi:predicted DsbA family dithiol-disulfide isomerase